MQGRLIITGKLGIQKLSLYRLIITGLHRPANKAALAGAVLLSFPRSVDAWSVSHGGCTFSDGPDQELLRAGSCSAQSGTLWLNSRNPKIKSLSAGVFDDMQATE